MISNIAESAPLAEEALNAFLRTLLGGDLALDVAEPAESPADEATAALTEKLAVLGMSGKRLTFAVLLDNEWLAVLSKAMLGEAMSAEDEGADDLVRELAAQGYGSVRNALASEGIKLPEVSYLISLPGTVPQLKALPQELAVVPFTMEDDERTLTGKALLPLQVSLPQQPAPQETAAPESTPQAPPQKQVPVSPASFPDLGNEQILSQLAKPNFGLLAEVHLEVTVELGRRQLPLADVLNFTTGSVIELEKLVGEPLQVYANGRLIAEGEAVVIDEQFGVRITSLASARQRAKAFL